MKCGFLHLFYFFWRMFCFISKCQEDEHQRSWEVIMKLMVNILEPEQASCGVDDFCMHTWPWCTLLLSIIFHGEAFFKSFLFYFFVTSVSPIWTLFYWGWLKLLIAWVFYFSPLYSNIWFPPLVGWCVTARHWMSITLV